MWDTAPVLVSALEDNDPVEAGLVLLEKNDPVTAASVLHLPPFTRT